MELWVRTSNRERLLKVNDLMYIERNGHHYITSDEYCDETLGSYKTKERALEVLDEIEGLLLLKEGLKLTGDAVYSVENNLAIYEMPKE